MSAIHSFLGLMNSCCFFLCFLLSLFLQKSHLIYLESNYSFAPFKLQNFKMFVGYNKKKKTYA